MRAVACAVAVPRPVADRDHRRRVPGAGRVAPAAAPPAAPALPAPPASLQAPTPGLQGREGSRAIQPPRVIASRSRRLIAPNLQLRSTRAHTQPGRSASPACRMPSQALIFFFLASSPRLLVLYVCSIPAPASSRLYIQLCALWLLLLLNSRTSSSTCSYRYHSVLVPFAGLAWYWYLPPASGTSRAKPRAGRGSCALYFVLPRPCGCV